MKINNIYPKINYQLNKFLIFRKITLIIFLTSIIISTIINLSIGGKVWTLYIVGAELIFYFAFLNKPLIDNTFIKRITIVIFTICLYLYLIDIVEHTNWSYYVIGIIAFSVILVQLTLFFSSLKLQRKKFMPMFWTSIGSVIFCILAIAKVVQINWPIIVLGSLGLAVLLILLVVFRKTIIIELKKYFNIN